MIPDVIKKSPGAVFLMVGDGEYKKQLEDDVLSAGFGDHVHFTGRVAHKEIPGYINSMDITILPDSNGYGSPMKVFEYMAMKKSVVAPDVQPVQEIIEQGVTGIIVGRSNESDLTRSIVDLVSNEKKRQTIAGAALDYVVKNHTWDVNASKIIDVFNSLNRSH